MKNTIVTRAIAYSMGASAAVATLLMATAAHAQVTFSATAPQTALQTVVDGGTTFFYANMPAILLTGLSISLVVAFISWLFRKLRGGTRA